MNCAHFCPRLVAASCFRSMSPDGNHGYVSAKLDRDERTKRWEERGSPATKFRSNMGLRYAEYGLVLPLIPIGEMDGLRFALRIYDVISGMSNANCQADLVVHY
ncbi:Hypothetical protein NTJ_00452 [Nesidiocoris tenuis]|uniref:Uncharacterized protein n=1 Tax=Nesidiocoris tenuis TaxID=355587 RepID=A0ABN7A9W6_9HEMI|nr:Hypothetical protein NTJ_00452 [Nesidiocoris tenuis]